MGSGQVLAIVGTLAFTLREVGPWGEFGVREERDLTSGFGVEKRRRGRSAKCAWHTVNPQSVSCGVHLLWKGTQTLIQWSLPLGRGADV